MQAGSNFNYPMNRPLRDQICHLLKSGLTNYEVRRQIGDMSALFASRVGHYRKKLKLPMCKRGRRPKDKPVHYDAAVAMKAAGKNYPEIGAHFGFSRQRAYQIVNFKRKV